MNDLKNTILLTKDLQEKPKNWVIVFKEAFQSKAEAMKREQEIKKWKSRKRIQKLIDNNH